MMMVRLLALAVIVTFAGVLLHPDTKAIDPSTTFGTLSANQQVLMGLLIFVPLSVFVLVGNILRRPTVEAGIVVTTASVAAFFGIAFFVLDRLRVLDNLSVSILSIVIAIVALLIQQNNAFLLQRRKHTLDTLIQYRQSELVNRHRMNVLAQLGKHDSPISLDVIDPLLDAYYRGEGFERANVKDGEIPVMESVFYLTNYFEYISTAVLHKDLDVRLLNETIGGHMRSWYGRFRHFIEHPRNLNIDADGRPRTITFLNYWTLIKTVKAFEARALPKRWPKILTRPE